jgi:hypothetical protein
MERLEAELWPSDPFDKAVFPLHDVVEVFVLNDVDHPPCLREFEDDVLTLQTGQVGAALVDCDAIRDAIYTNCVFEKPSRGGGIAAL